MHPTFTTASENRVLLLSVRLLCVLKVRALKDHFSLSQLREVAFSTEELMRGGCSVQDLMAEGSTIRELKANGVGIRAFLDLEIDLEALKEVTKRPYPSAAFSRHCPPPHLRLHTPSSALFPPPFRVVGSVVGPPLHQSLDPPLPLPPFPTNRFFQPPPQPPTAHRRTLRWATRRRSCGPRGWARRR